MELTQSKPERQPQARGVQPELLADGLLTVADAAKFLSVGRTTVYAAMETGLLVYCKIGRARRIPRQALIDFAAASLTGGWAMQPNPLLSSLPQDVDVQEVATPCCQRVATPTNQNWYRR